MRAATIREQEIVLAEHPDPIPGTGEVLVRVHAAGLNGGDMMQRRGLYPAPAGSPQDIPGMEFAGEVAALGPGATRFPEGERVMAIVGGGAQAELVVAHERVLMPVPESLDWPAAGGLPEVFTTAHDALFSQAQLRPGERLLVHGGAGGVGTAAIQLARATGASVTATVRNEALREQVSKLGASVIAPEGFAGRGPFDVILELVGAPNMPENMNALATGGRVTVIGVSAGVMAEVNLLALMGKRARIHGSTLRPARWRRKRSPRAARARGAAPVRYGRAARTGRRDLPARSGRCRLRALRCWRQARQDRPYALAPHGRHGRPQRPPGRQ